MINGARVKTANIMITKSIFSSYTSSISGLAAALAFQNSGFTDIHIYESRPEAAVVYQPPEESYPIGVNTRGLRSLQELISGGNGSPLDTSRLGSLVSSWKILVTKRAWEVAKFESGAVHGTTRSTVVQILLEEIKKREPHITVHYEHSVQDVNVGSKTVSLRQKENISVQVHCDFLVVADGHRSRSRDALAKQSDDVVVRQWPWNVTFRVLLSDNSPSSDSTSGKNLDVNVHYIVNSIYVATIPDGRWVAVTSCRASVEEEQFLLSTEASDENVRRLKEHIKNNAPIAQHLFSDKEYRDFFGRATFTGAVTRISKVLVNGWALIIGDAAHSAIPASGEGFNSSLEDAKVLQQALMEQRTGGTSSIEQIAAAFNTFQERRLADIHALNELAYNYVNPSVKGKIQSILIPLIGRLVSQSTKLKSEAKESIMFGPSTLDHVFSYSEIVKEWDMQVKLLGGRPKIPL